MIPIWQMGTEETEGKSSNFLKLDLAQPGTENSVQVSPGEPWSWGLKTAQCQTSQPRNIYQRHTGMK